MARRSRASRYEVVVTPDLLKKWNERKAAWYESPEEVEEGLAWGREKARLLRWVRKQMRGRLTARQRMHIELFYFQGMTYRQVAQALGINSASAHRSIKRALGRLKLAAAQQGVRPRRGRKPE